MDKLQRPHVHSLPAIHSSGGGGATSPGVAARVGDPTAAAGRGTAATAGAPLSKRSKYSLTTDSRSPTSMKRAKRCADQLTRSSEHVEVSQSPSPPPQQPQQPHTQADGAATRPFHLSPAESYVMAHKEASAERWRSSLLKHEADLRELVVTNSSSLGEEPPVTSRVIRVLKIYDGVCRASEELSPNLAEMLRLFRLEFCRAIFSNLLDLGDDDDGDFNGSGSNGGRAGANSAAEEREGGGKPRASSVVRKSWVNQNLANLSEDDVTTYFDQVGTLVRENALLSAEVAVGNSRARMLELTKEVEQLNGRIRLYESEIGRLARQCDQILEQCNNAREELAEAKVQHKNKIASNEKELQCLNVENKDLQLQLFRLRKQVAGGKAKHLKDAYRQMKTDKMQLLTTLFSEGDERIAILVLMSQLENRVNEALDRYDNDLSLTAPIAHSDLRGKMAETVSVLLEEMHLCEQNYRRLVPKQERDPTSEDTDETDGYVAILFDQKIYENLLAREAIKEKLRYGAALLAQHDGGDAHGPAAASMKTGAPPPPPPPLLPPSPPATDPTAPATEYNQSGAFTSPQKSERNGSPRKKTQEPQGVNDKQSPPPPLSDDDVLPPPPQQQQQQQEEAEPSPLRMNRSFMKCSFAEGGGESPENNVVALRPPSATLSRQTSRSPVPHATRAVSSTSLARSGGENKADAQLEAEELVFLKRSEWIERIFAVSSQEKLIRDVWVYLANRTSGKAFSPESLLPRLLKNPLHDLSSKKFLSTIDVFCGQDPVQQRRLCTISYVDPAIPIQIPEKSNFLKIKYRSPNAPRTTKGNLASLQDAVKERTSADGRRRSRLTSDGGGGGGDEHARESGVFFMTAAGDIARLRSGSGHDNTQLRQTRPGSGMSAPQSADRRDFGHGVAAKRLKEWGSKTEFTDELPTNNNNNANINRGNGIATSHTTLVGRDGRTVNTGTRGRASSSHADADADEEDGIFNVNENLRVFRELTNPSLMKAGKSDKQKASATSSTTASTVAFQRLNPLSPNRGPEWSVYKTLFGGFRSLTPRMIEVTTIDHILMSSCERHFARMEYRYEESLKDANVRATNSQMSLAMAERFFRESFELSDFQEALVDELEARYSFPELVAKTLYEILCYLDAMAHKEELLALYLNVIRGFQPPTHLHYISYMLFHLSYCWPTSDPTDEVSREDALTVLRYLYRNCEHIVHVDIHEVLRDFQMTTRSAPITFVTMRKFMASAMMHQEECLLLYLNGLFSSHCECDSLDRLTYESYEAVISKHWQQCAEQKSVVRFLSTGLGLDRGPLLCTKDLAAIASSEWCSNLWV